MGQPHDDDGAGYDEGDGDGGTKAGDGAGYSDGGIGDDGWAGYDG